MCLNIRVNVSEVCTTVCVVAQTEICNRFGKGIKGLHRCWGLVPSILQEKIQRCRGHSLASSGLLRTTLSLARGSVGDYTNVVEMGMCHGGVHF
jgi:hypothetical protein